MFVSQKRMNRQNHDRISTNARAEDRIRRIAEWGVDGPGHESAPDSLTARFPVDLGHVRLHSDERARVAAGLLGARAYAFGDRIALAETEAPARLIAHELAHVVQQGGGSPSPHRPDESARPPRATSTRGQAGRPSSISSLESEAAEASVRVLEGRASPPLSAARNAPQFELLAYAKKKEEVLPGFGEIPITTTFTLSSDAGAIQTALGALIAAGKVIVATKGEHTAFAAASTCLESEVMDALTKAGFPRASEMAAALMAPNEAQLFVGESKTETFGPFFHETGSVQTNLLTPQNERFLTENELAEAKTVFGTTIDLAKVKIISNASLTVGGAAWVFYHTIRFPEQPEMAWLIHELTHVWQAEQNGCSYLFEGGYLQASSFIGYDPYAYGGPEKLKSARAEGKTLTSFNIEQQADIVRDYYILLKSGKDTSVYAPFIADLRGG